MCVVGACLNAGLIITFLNYKVNQEDFFIYFIFSALWGLADAVWQTQTNGKWKLSTPKNNHNTLNGLDSGHRQMSLDSIRYKSCVASSKAHGDIGGLFLHNMAKDVLLFELMLFIFSDLILGLEWRNAQ